MKTETSMFDDDKAPDDSHIFGGDWTLIKLEALEKYLTAFNTALSKQNFQRLYIDAFAGTGRCDITTHGEKSCVDGSARRALKVNPPFHKFSFIELMAKKTVALKALELEYPEKAIEVIHDDANVALKAICDKTAWRNSRAVLFLDPFGMHVEWSTLEAIAKTEAIDVWYLFPYAALYRQAAKSADAMDSDKLDSITRILGTSEWRQKFYTPTRQFDMFGQELGDIRDATNKEMLKYFSDRLKSLFPAVSEPKILYQGGNSKASSGAPLFALYFAASNKNPRAFGLALKIANDILKSLD